MRIAGFDGRVEIVAIFLFMPGFPSTWIFKRVTFYETSPMRHIRYPYGNEIARNTQAETLQTENCGLRVKLIQQSRVFESLRIKSKHGRETCAM